MGKTNENICKKFDISREEQDIFAFNSYIKVIFVEKNFLFSQEILPIKYNIIVSNFLMFLKEQQQQKILLL